MDHLPHYISLLISCLLTSAAQRLKFLIFQTHLGNSLGCNFKLAMSATCYILLNVPIF